MEQCKPAGPAVGAALRVGCGIASEKVSQMDSQINSLRDAVVFLEEQISRLEDRLQPVAVAEPPVCDNQKDQVAGALVPMAEELYQHRGIVHRVNDRIGSLLERLEV